MMEYEGKKDCVLKMSRQRKAFENLDLLFLNTTGLVVVCLFVFFFTLLLTVAKELVCQGIFFNQGFLSNQQLQQVPQVRTKTAKQKLASSSSLSFSSFIKCVYVEVCGG